MNQSTCGTFVLWRSETGSQDWEMGLGHAALWRLQAKYDLAGSERIPVQALKGRRPEGRVWGAGGKQMRHEGPVMWPKIAGCMREQRRKAEPSRPERHPLPSRGLFASRPHNAA